MHLLYAIIGACIAGIPLAGLLLYQSHNNAALRHQVGRYEQCEQDGLYLYVWTLKHDISAGKTITRADLEQTKAWIPQADDPERFGSLKQLAGRKAISDLKKGTVIRPGLLTDQKKGTKSGKNAPD